MRLKVELVGLFEAPMYRSEVEQVDGGFMFALPDGRLAVVEAALPVGLTEITYRMSAWSERQVVQLMGYRFVGKVNGPLEYRLVE